jgi:hypothetical protein
MTKINLNDISGLIDTIDAYRIPLPKVEREGFIKVNLNDLTTLSRRKPQAKEIIHTSFDLVCETYETEEEIVMLKALIKITAIRKARQGVDYNLGDDRRFIRLSKIEKVKAVIDILSMGIDVLIDGYLEEANQKNIDQLISYVKKSEIEKVETDKRINSNVKKLARMK